MKKSTLPIIAVALMFSACGVISQSGTSESSARFEDNIYSSAPTFRSKEDRQTARNTTDDLIERTRSAQTYIHNQETEVTDWTNYIDPWAYYTPYSIGSSWHWSRHWNPWYWNPWSYTPWRYHGWYDPFYIGGWYDPWYYGYGGWYGGWYGSWYGGWYDPWYGHVYPHHCGWYDPWYGNGPIYSDRDIWRGSRSETVGARSLTSGTRNGFTNTGRAVTASSGTRVGRTSGTAVNKTSGIRVSRPSAGRTDRTGSAAPRYRKPAADRSSGTTAPSRTESYRSSGGNRTTGTTSPSRSESFRSSGSTGSYRSSGTPSPSRSSSYGRGGSTSRSGSYGGRR